MSFDDIFFDMFISYDDDTIKSEAYLNIRPNSKIDEKDLEKSLKEAFKKIKLSLMHSELSYGIVDDKEIIENLKKYVQLPPEERKKDIFKFVLARGKKPIPGEDSKLIEHIDLKKKKTGVVDPKTGNVDHRDLGFSDRIVPKGTKILTLIKPTPGEDGISVTGEILPAEPGKLIHKIKYDPKSIIPEESDDKIEYISQKEGFLYADDKKGYFVDEKVLVQAVDFNVGHIKGDKVDDSTVLVEGKNDILEDAVKPGFKVEAKNVKIKGNVGVEAHVKGDTVQIIGITDKKSFIEGNQIQINKAFNNIIKGRNVIIHEANGAKIYGDKVIIKKETISCEIFASEVIILEDSRGTEFFIDKFLFINKLSGNAKQFILLDNFVREEKKEEYENLIQQKDNLINKLTELEEAKEKIKEDIEKYNKKIEEIIKKYFKFSPEKYEEQLKIVKDLIKTGKWEYLEEKFKIEFALFDLDVIKKYYSLFVKNDEINRDLKQFSMELDGITLKENKFISTIKKAKVIIKNSEEPNLKVKYNEQEIDINVLFGEPIIIYIELGKLKFETITSFSKEKLSSDLKDFVSDDIYKLLTKLKIVK